MIWLWHNFDKEVGRVEAVFTSSPPSRTLSSLANQKPAKASFIYRLSCGVLLNWLGISRII